MEKLEELLPGIDKYLTISLAKEPLSNLAERQRLYYVERLDIIQLPPHLPPKPEGEKSSKMVGRELPEPKNKGNDDFIATQRMISRQTLSSQESTENKVPNNGEGLDSDQYEEGLYEEPIPMEDNPSTANSPSTQQIRQNASSYTVLESDGGSSTSYESYDEPDGDEPYNNITYDGHVKADIPLPRIKSKKSKKPRSINERYYKQLQSIRHEGELYHRGKVAFTSSWTKTYCAICDGIFYCYKDKESKPVFSISLHGYDVILLEKEKGRSNVLRLSHPGCETHFLSTDSASEIQAWSNALDSVCNMTAEGATSETSSSNLGHYQTGSQSSMEANVENYGNKSPQINGSPSTGNRSKLAATLSSDHLKKEKKGKITKFLSETFGKKKGQKIAQHLEISGGSLLDSKTLASPDISIAGVVKLSSQSLGDPNWQYKQCAIRNGVFECFKDDSTSSDLEFSLMLGDCELQPADRDSDKPLALCINRSGETAFMIEPDNRLDHGSWLSALLKHVGNGSVHPISPEDCDSMNYTYVDSQEFLTPHQQTIFNTAKIPDVEFESEERQYADLSDHNSDGEDGASLNVMYDQPAHEIGIKEALEQIDKLFDDDNVYEEVAEDDNRTNKMASQPSQHTKLKQESSPPASSKPANKSDTKNVGKKKDMPPCKPEIKIDKEPKERQTRIDVPTKANFLVSPTISESSKPAFSRESSCSSECGSKKLGENVAKSRAMFESNSTPSNTKWSGFKLAGAAPVKRTPSISSQSTKSSSNSANSSPLVSRSNSALSNSDKPSKDTLNPGNVDRVKAVFETNNNIIDKKMTPSPNTKRRNSGQNMELKSTETSRKGRISPIKIEDDEKPPPKFTSVFNTKTTTTSTNSKPRKFEIKSMTPSPTSSGAVSPASSGKYESARLEINLSGTGKHNIKVGTTSVKRSTKEIERKSATLPPSNSNSKLDAKSFLTSTLKKFTAEPATAPVLLTGTYESEAEEKKRLDELRQSLTSLRKERQKVRDQKLSTVLPEDRDKLDVEYKRIDVEYKTIQKEISLLEERNLQRIKDSIERRKSLASDKSTLESKKKMWEAGQ